MSKKILVATDLGELGGVAVSAALALARSLNAKVDLLHVSSMNMLAAAGAPTSPHESRLCAELEREARDITAAGLLGEILLHVGEPVLRILEAAKIREADLIVLGSHARSGLSRVVLGSTAESVLRESQVPVLVVKKPLGAPPRTIGVAVDLGPQSSRVVASGIALAQALGARAHLLHAYPAMVVPNEYGSGSIPHDALHTQALDALRHLAAPYRDSPALGKCAVDLGDAASIVLELAEELRVDLLVLGTAGRQGLTRLMAGSVAESLLRRTDLPVLLTRHRH
jgi:nucleotide-binding universal stress UspA family protein